jgi:rfaE bifunctional protein nucleotidyltransferase chain/domain
VSSRKIRAVSDLVGLTREARARGERVVLCHGCFDIVHPGHVRHLQQAARLGDRLLVTITGDAMVEKGTGRPLIPQELRAENLAALDCVDWVAVNTAPTAVALLEAIRPDVYVKGREYEENRDPRFAEERHAVERHGGRVVFTSGDVVFSSTALIEAWKTSIDPTGGRLGQLFEAEGADAAAMERLIDGFRGRRVLVVGETIRDVYVMCDRPHVASEAPVLTLRPLEQQGFDAGAAIVARHMAAMGAEPVLLTALPADDTGEAVCRRLEDEGVTTHPLRYTGELLEKRRFLVGTDKVVKLDPAGPLVIDAAGRAELVEAAKRLAVGCEAAVLADFGQGLFTVSTMRAVCRALRRRVPLLAGDVSGRRSNLLAMRRLDLLCPSESEIREALHDYDRGLSTVVWKLLHRTRSRSAIVSLGGEGAIAFDCPPGTSLAPDDWQTRLGAEHVPALCRHAIDELGCGDALLAAATLTRVAGGSMTLAAVVGQLAAARQGQQLGNVVVGAADLRRGVRSLASRGIVCAAPPEVTAGDQLRLAHAEPA